MSDPVDVVAHPVCDRCGARAPADVPPLGWSSGVERGRHAWLCESCARDNLRGIEAKLESDWW